MSRGTRIYVGNLPKDCRERDLEKEFKNFGRLRDVLVKTGYGFVEFDDHRDADEAVYDMNGRSFMGERITCEFARGTRRDRSRDRERGSRAPWMDKYGPPQRTKYRVIVENLSTRVSWQDLKDLMRRAGEVSYADAHKDRRNEGVVEFASRRDMERAIDKYDGHEMNGREIKMVLENKSSRSRSRSRRSRSRRSRSGSKSRSRSRSGRSRSKSRNKKSRSKSKSRDRKKSKRSSRSKSRDKKSRSKSRDKKSRSKSRDKKSRSRSRSGSRTKNGDAESRSRSRSRSGSGGSGKNGDKSD